MNVTKIPKKTISVIEPKRSLIVNREQYHQRRVAAYCRVSTDSEEQLTSYANQRKVYTEMIGAKPEWEFAGLYADEGISGTRADKRPQFQKMINDCLSGKIDYIITKSVSRFARNTVAGNHEAAPFPPLPIRSRRSPGQGTVARTVRTP